MGSVEPSGSSQPLSPSPRVTRAVRKVYSLAVVNLQDDLVTTSCAVFLEMIGQDSTTLRVDLSAARRIIDNVGEADDSDPGDDAVKKQERQQRIGEMEGGLMQLHCLWLVRWREG